MSGRTWLMMLAILAINWGGFVLALSYGLRREKRSQGSGGAKGGKAKQKHET